MAHELIVEDNVKAAAPSRFDDLFPDGDKPGHHALATVVGTLTVADRLELPIFADDRYLRAHARGAGIPTFGIAALLDALVARGRLEQAERDTAIARLRLSGAHGLPASPEEAAAEVRASGGKLSHHSLAMISDRTLWFDPMAANAVALAILRVALEEDPDGFEAWVVRLISAAQAARPEHGGLPPAVLLLDLAWLQEDARFIDRLTSVLAKLRLSYGFLDVHDYVPLAVQLFVGATSQLPDAVRNPLLLNIFRKVGLHARIAFLPYLSSLVHESSDVSATKPSGSPHQRPARRGRRRTKKKPR
jgi:hypothetical protein